MNDFDKKIKRLSKEFQVPETYHQRVNEILEAVQEDSVVAPKRKPFFKAAVIVAVFVLIMTGFTCFSGAEVVEASFLENFKQTILDFFGISEDESQEIGMKSEKGESVSRPDLMIELQEIVMDSQNIYAVVKITAPPDVELKEGMTFDYFGFCKGSNYNASEVLPGARACEFFEVLERRKNVATFILNISTDQQVEDGEEVTAFFKDLIAGPYEKTPQILVEGMWSLTFTASYTVSGDITIEGTSDMEYAFLGKTASVTEIKLLPLGLTVTADVSPISTDLLHFSDTNVTIRLKMADGTERTVGGAQEGEMILTSEGSITEYEEDNKTMLKYVYQFGEAINTGHVLGIYIEDCYVPLKEFG